MIDTAWVEVMPIGLFEHDPAMHVALFCSSWRLARHVRHRFGSRLGKQRIGACHARRITHCHSRSQGRAADDRLSQQLLDPFCFVESFVDAKSNLGAQNLRLTRRATSPRTYFLLRSECGQHRGPVAAAERHDVRSWRAANPGSCALSGTVIMWCSITGS